MNILDKLAAQRAKIEAMKSALPAAPSAPAGWVHIGERRGKPVYRVYATFAKRANPVASLLDRLPKERSEHKVGDTCPHCLGSGRYSAHRGHFHNEKCYRCDGKGVLNARDIGYLNRRLSGGEPLCRIVTA